ncbi:Mur ligase family protein [Actinomyces vulturis]|uniref:Mur ligase family protein n=1 Tax=Actinomyces vulturis TaxID=1857645 RepID=UPI0008377C0A|nr:Mur ligase family protein [Actinomyces vulturis]
MRSRLTVTLGRSARAVARLRGGGSALPGLVAEKLDPGFMGRTLAPLPHGVIVVSGTNGKTTTTKMVVDLLRSQGLKVFTNPTGSNFTRGVVASLLTAVDSAGHLDADVAVLELDEAHAVHFVKRVKPRACLLLNVMRDQLDRFGEIDYTASLLHKVAEATTELVVTNANDPRLASPSFLEGLTAHVESFGVGPGLSSLFLSDDDLRTGAANTTFQPARECANSETMGQPSTVASTCPTPVARLDSLTGNNATITLDGTTHSVTFTIPGVHNVLNATAAMALVHSLMGSSLNTSAMIEAASHVSAAFGRGETITYHGCSIEMALVKNPAGFRMSLLSSTTDPRTCMIAINDEYADGRDMSWLWDVEFAPLREQGVAVVTGKRAWDMALRLKYDDVPVGHIDPSLSSALRKFLDDNAHQGATLRIFTTYTAMLALRAALAQLTDVDEVL